MSDYCGPCVHLDSRKKRCDEFNQRLPYCKVTGSISFTAFEKCDGCKATDAFTKKEMRKI